MLPSFDEMGEIERTAGGVIVCGFAGAEPPAEVRAWLTEDTVAGLILFKRNIEGVDQTAEMIKSLSIDEGAESPPLLCVDQEGGRVARFGEPVLRLPPMRELAALDDLGLTKDAGTVLGLQLRAIGINLDFAPVLDVDTNPANPVIGDRAFGSSPETVIAHAVAFAEGLHAGGVLSCGKHFPGHGDTDVDSHLALPTLRHDRTRLERVELPPFRAAVNALPSLMTAHVVFERLDPGVPATMSRKAIAELLRRDVGFDGVVFSDDLEMKAVSDRYSIEDAGVLAIEAGCDALLVCSDLEAAGRLRERLATEASRTPAFGARLDAAYERVRRLRQRVRTLPPAVSLENALDHALTRDVQERLRQIA
jgi:beta-N-acetylhexosaminidase